MNRALPIFAALAVSFTGCTAQRKTLSPPMPTTVTLLGFPGCPNTPAMDDRLAAAIRTADLPLTVEHVDLLQLPASDPRLGYGAPTILVGTSDLFGMPPAGSAHPTCRVYPGGLPEPSEIADRLREALQR